MENLYVRVGIFWAVPSKEKEGWEFRICQKSYPASSAKQMANSLGFIDYPYSHFDEWDDARHEGDSEDCYYYPRGRVLYDAKHDRHRVFADECLKCADLDEIIFDFDIEDMELCRDEHYVSHFTELFKANTLKYNILRGRDKIGENLIEITYGSTKLLLELGKALDGDEKSSEIERKAIDEKYAAVIVSHYHADHAGLIAQKQGCPIYIGAGARRLLKVMYEFKGSTMPDNIFAYKNRRPFYVGKIKVTPFLCDHSAYDSYMLLFEAGGKSILYTGDFRLHGRKDSEALLAQLPKCVDVLITEGTNICSDKPCYSERELEEQAVKMFKTTDKPVFVLQSSSNIDRLVSIYRSAKRCGRILYEDVYTASLACAAGGSIPRPDVFNDVYAFTPRYVQGVRKDMFFEFRRKCGMAKIAKGRPFVMLVNQKMLGYLKELSEYMDIKGGLLIYSMWSGYRECDGIKKFLEGAKELGLVERTLHTSGHASKQDLERLAERVSALEYVLVHTEHIDSLSLLKELTLRGIRKKFPSPEEAERRAEYELALIEKYGLADYFLAACDVVGYAKRANIFVGTGRGSIVGSVEAYALNITDVDPIKHGLDSDSFWESERKEIAIDVDRDRQGDIVDYLCNHYRAVKKVGLTGYQIIMNGLSLPPLNILGWEALSAIRRTMDSIEFKKGVSVDFDYDDPDVFDMLASGNTEGIFGLDFIGAGDFMRAIHPTKLEELVEALTIRHLSTTDNALLGGRSLENMSREEIFDLYAAISNSEHSVMLCRSHNFSYYGYTTFQMAYLKCHFSEQF